MLGVAAYGDLKLDVPADYKHFEDNKKPEFLSKFPHGKVPAFEGKDGFLLTEQYAITRYCEFLTLERGFCVVKMRRTSFSYPCLNSCVDSVMI